MSHHSERVERALSLLGGLATADVALAPLTTYKVGGHAAVFARPRGVDDLALIADTSAVTGLAVLVVGRGSNMLVADRGFDGIAVSLVEMAGGHTIDDTVVTAGAMVSLPQLARQLTAVGVTGFEWAVGVPGSIGGAVKMNAGGHGGDMQACLLDVELFDLCTRRHGRVPAELLGLRFRGSNIADHQIVVDARLQLAHGDPARSAAELDDVVRWRREHQPGGQNAGSVFINPIPGELSAGELIDRVGLRGLVHGSATVSPKHANFIQAAEGGRAADVLELIEIVRAKVAADTGFLLRSEVRLVGFDGGANDAAAGVTW